MLQVNYTSSLGSLCHSSQILKRNNLKLFLTLLIGFFQIVII